MGFFQGTQERVRNSRGERAISVRATEGRYVGCKVLLGEYIFTKKNTNYIMTA